VGSPVWGREGHVAVEKMCGGGGGRGFSENRGKKKGETKFSKGKKEGGVAPPILKMKEKARETG